MSSDTTHGHPEMDYREHNRTYAGFIRGTQILVVLLALLLLGMALFLA
ncbi:MAG TPA: aa3-type cytochrome c oxidase subunit IV [Hyphomicrobiaceae bacterium]|nr:aa3-type cytochrome c oxidase subunit IV [Hyphomicrobiaceae bacterium]